MEVGDKLNPQRPYRKGFALKGIQQHIIKMNNPSTVGPDELLTVCFPDLTENQVIIPIYRTWGYQHTFQFYGSVGPLECIFMAPLTLFNEGAPANFLHLMEAPTMRLPNIKMLLCWPSRMHIYGFIENHTFLVQFVRMGVPAQFSQPCMAPSG